ncbi:hypothetical protein TBLA_0H00810 [Henningerozyma blattae CBS 6284]|uniref:Octanoyltransferase n=1 Tax=Henningerozyma blattae (strain ATCC 34711 / CBS 6284 / DSM 70876 / NBRC 10599 / NRRL Y-10934 / UCD 77-7) TaxID=1071380 RepID=I2H7L8_HENB6|nr:hypothetical protein TBLA_0H00810 [Tetrapisispora blattae CBS 6284]CCH62370.1 hypothetical protein TBLA_0H00810 [Tetrapisispora blattae CBS 6284]
MFSSRICVRPFVEPCLRLNQLQKYLSSVALTRPKNESAKLLRHLQFTERIPFQDGLEIQEKFVRAQLDMKKLERKIQDKMQEIGDEHGPNAILNENEKKIIDYILMMKPNPIVLTFEFEPTFTGGKRIKKTITKEQIERFETFTTSGNHIKPKFVLVERGGQITFHGPGQMVAYVILDLQSFKNLRARDLVCILEKSMVRGLSMLKNNQDDSAALSLLTESRTGSETGIWIKNTNKKIGSLGINVRRSVTSHGVCINVEPDLAYLNNFRKCSGLPNCEATSINDQLPGSNINVQDMAIAFTKELAKHLGIERLERIQMTLEDMNLDNEQLENNDSK